MSSVGYDAPANVVSIRCGADVRKGQILKLSSGEVIPCSAAGENFFGIAINDQVDGEMVAVCVGGECDVEVADATLAVSSYAQTDANGRAILAAASDYVVGTMLEPGAAVISSRAAYRRIVVRMTTVQLPA